VVTIAELAVRPDFSSYMCMRQSKPTMLYQSMQSGAPPNRPCKQEAECQVKRDELVKTFHRIDLADWFFLFRTNDQLRRIRAAFNCLTPEHESARIEGLLISTFLTVDDYEIKQFSAVASPRCAMLQCELFTCD